MESCISIHNKGKASVVCTQVREGLVHPDTRCYNVFKVIQGHVPVILARSCKFPGGNFSKKCLQNLKSVTDFS